MLQLLFDGRKKKAKAVLANRLNKSRFADLQGTDRESDRSSFCRVVYLIPEIVGGWDFSEAVPVISRDLCTQGLSLIHRQRIESNRVLIGLPGEGGVTFLACQVEHSTDLGFNFFQIGLSVEEIVGIDSFETRALEERMKSQTDAQ